MPSSVSSALEPVAEQHRPPERDVELILELRRVKEERAVVGRRPDVRAVGRVELLAVGGADQPRVVAGRRAVDDDVLRAGSICARPSLERRAVASAAGA